MSLPDSQQRALAQIEKMLANTGILFDELADLAANI